MNGNKETLKIKMQITQNCHKTYKLSSRYFMDDIISATIHVQSPHFIHLEVCFNTCGLVLILMMVFLKGFLQSDLTSTLYCK